MRRIILLHGFNVSDAGEGSINRFGQHLTGNIETYSYGWVGPIRVMNRNKESVRELGRKLTPGTVLIGHSNAALIIRELAHIYSMLGAAVLINPADRRDATWPEHLPVLCLHNSYDYTVSAGKLWADRLWQGRGWGAAGRYGYDQETVRRIDTSARRYGRPVRGHSAIFKESEYWAAATEAWIVENAINFI